jgi:electron transfer flavoprotein beta subunit
MNIVVCVKANSRPSDIEVRPDGSISLERAEWGIGGFDLQAIEAGVALVEANGGKVIALTAGPQRINQSKLKKDILSRGPDELVMIADDTSGECGYGVDCGACAGGCDPAN